MQLEGQVGPQVLADGTIAPIRMGKLGDGIFSGLHGSYYEQTVRGNVFSYCNQSANALIQWVPGTSTAVTATQLVLSNNNGSGRNLVVLAAAVGTNTAATAAEVVGIVGGWSPTNVVHTTTGVVQCNMLGQSAGVGKIDIAATLPTTAPVGPTMIMPILSQGISAINPYMCWIDIGGSIILPPGGFLTFQQISATLHTAICAIMWEEVGV